MKSVPARSLPLALGAAMGWLLFLNAAVVAHGATVQTATTPWQQVHDLEAAGWSREGLDRARQLAIEARSGAVFVVHEGHVVAAWGDVERPFKMASVRKSLVSALYGVYVDRGVIDLDATLEGLDIDDLQGLTSSERLATVRDLLGARSGVYHPSAYEPSSMKRRRPERGSAGPGERWFYNNWDFNVLGTIFEESSGREVFDAFVDEVAQPLGFEDFTQEHGVEFLEPTSSIHAAHLFRVSARDLARFGRLYLDEGLAGGERVLSREWIEESTKIHTQLAEGNPYGAGGYGYLWWLYPGKPDAATAVERTDALIGRGNGGQVVAVLPEEDLVFVHCGDWYHERGVSFPQVGRILSAVLEARTASSSAELALGPVEATPFEHSLPAPQLLKREPLPAALRDRMVGTYRVSDKLSMHVHEFDERLFVKPYGLPLAEIELFPAGEGQFHNPVFPLEVRVTEETEERVLAVRVKMGPQPLVARRVEERAASPSE